jgi:hypothetical protein
MPIKGLISADEIQVETPPSHESKAARKCGYLIFLTELEVVLDLGMGFCIMG